MVTAQLRHKILKLLRMYDIMVIGPLTVYLNHKEVRNFYDTIVKACRKIGYKAYNAHKFTDPHKHPHIDPRDIYYINKKLVSGVRLVIAYVGSPSTGTGQELEIAEDNNVPIILIYEKGKKVSRMVLGSPSVVDKVEFSKFKDAIPKIEKALRNYFKKYPYKTA